MLSASSLHTQFRKPPATLRGKPLWSWNGHLEKEELIRQVGVLAEMGYGGFFMHARTGLTTKYLGPEWMKAIQVCCNEAKRLGLESWLYDEDRWPSGAAGGLATRLRPVTEKIPKALVDVGGKPFIAQQLRLLRSQGVQNVIISAWYRGEMIREYVGDGSRFGVSVRYVFDGETPQGTGGAVRQGLPFLDGPFFLLYGDSYLT